MPGRKTDNITRVDIRIPNKLYDEIQAIAIEHFNAKIHHRSNKPEVTPTILELIKIGIAHLDTSLPATDTSTTEELRKAVSFAGCQRQIALLDSRLTEVEKQLSNTNVTAPISKSPTVKEKPVKYNSSEEKVLTDEELSNVLGVSNLLIRDYRVKGKKPRGAFLAKALTEQWEIRGEGWVKKN
jgi:hypothetical protein